MERWKKCFGLLVALGSMFVLTMDMIIFAVGRASCHYSAYGEWMLELFVLLVGIAFVLQMIKELE